MGDTPVGLLPDFRASGCVVGVGIIRIIELIQQFAFTALSHRQRQVARPFHPLLFGHQYQFSTVSPHRGAALLTHVVRHQQLHAVAFQRGNHRQRNAGIPAGGLNEHVAWLNFTALLSLDNHRQRRAVFD